MCPPIPAADDAGAHKTGKGIFRRKNSARRGSDASKMSMDAKGPLRFGDSLKIREFTLAHDNSGGNASSALSRVAIHDIDVLPVEHLRRVHGGPVLLAEIGEKGTLRAASSIISHVCRFTRTE